MAKADSPEDPPGSELPPEIDIFHGFAVQLNRITTGAQTPPIWAQQVAGAAIGALEALAAKGARRLELRTFGPQILAFAQDAAAERWLVSSDYLSLLHEILKEVGRRVDDWFRNRGDEPLHFHFSVPPEQPGLRGSRYGRVALLLDSTGTLAELDAAGIIEETKAKVWAALGELKGKDPGLGSETEPPSSAHRRTERVKYRDAIILNGLKQGLQRFEICKILDEKIVPTTSGMKKHGYTRWQDAWTNLDAREKVQQVFSKTLRRQKSVKS